MNGFFKYKGDQPGIEILNMGNAWIPLHRDIPNPVVPKNLFCDDIVLAPGNRYVRSFTMENVSYFPGMKQHDGGNGDEGLVPLHAVEIPRNLQKDSDRKAATAPYNFVPLQGENEVVYAQSQKTQFDRFENAATCNSGYIDLILTSKTPIFSRGEKAEFFTVADVPTLAGSSIRGMTRTLVEISSYSKFSEGSMYEDKRYFYRNIRDKHYKERILKVDRNHNPDRVQVMTKAGWLKKMGGDYHITPAASYGGNQIFRVFGDFVSNQFRTRRGVSLDLHTFGNIYFDPGSTQDFHRTNVRIAGRQVSFDLAYNLIDDHSPRPQAGFQLGYLIASGAFANNKHFQPVILGPDPSAKGLNAMDAAVLYESDSSRDEDIDLLKLLESHPRGVPCFYQDDGKGNVVSFGHTPVYRLPYVYKTHDQVGLKFEKEKPDLAEAIFGRGGDNSDQSIIAGRVNFEDAPLRNGKTGMIGLPKILSSPKPTSFQLYLEQDPRCGYQTPEKQLIHWGMTGARIRGYKGYWHRTDSDGRLWKNHNPEIPIPTFESAINVTFPGLSLDQFLSTRNFLQKIRGEGGRYTTVRIGGQFPDKYVTDEEFRKVMEALFFPASGKTKAQFQPITPLPTGSEFKGRIRFENLTDVELGALLFVLELEDGLAHKLGLGKPIGLGSIRIEPTVYIIDRQQRYGSLFANDKLETAERRLEPSEIKDLQDKFAAHVGQGISKPGIDSASKLWEEERMKALKTMLTFRHAIPDKPQGEFLDRTEYGTIPGVNGTDRNGPKPFAERRVLPKPGQVIDKDTRF